MTVSGFQTYRPHPDYLAAVPRVGPQCSLARPLVDWVWYMTAAKRLAVTAMEVVDLIRCGRLVGEHGRRNQKDTRHPGAELGFWVRHDSLIDLEAEFAADPPQPPAEIRLRRPGDRRRKRESAGFEVLDRETHKERRRGAFERPVLYALLTLADVSELARRRDRLADAGHRFHPRYGV